MSADIYYHPLGQIEPENFGSELIGGAGMCWTEKVGDREGNPMLIASEGDTVQYCIGRLEKETPEGISFRTMGKTKTLMPGEEDRVVVYSKEDGEEYLLHIRNLGSSAVVPSLN